MKIESLTPKFVEFIPDVIEEGILYISMEYAIATHKCACGCGEIAPISLGFDRWSLLFKNNTVTIEPSLGHRFACKSHYYIRENKIVWA